jgi:hypothetical protein
MKSIPPPGSWCWGEQNVKYRVLSSTKDTVTIEYQDRPVPMPLSKVIGWEMPKFQAGDRVLATTSLEPVGVMARVLDCTPYVCLVKYDNGSEGFGDPAWWDYPPVYWEGCLVVLNGNCNVKGYVVTPPTSDGIVVVRQGGKLREMSANNITPAVPQK